VQIGNAIITLVVVAVLAVLLLSPGSRVGEVINSLFKFQIKSVLALQGRESKPYGR
jgi:hypothetical protein